jgi:hypothetical protein
MCEIQDKEYYIKCQQKYTERKQYIEKISNIQMRCPHFGKCFDDGDLFWGCYREDNLKNSLRKGEGVPNCEPSLECEKYCDGSERR